MVHQTQSSFISNFIVFVRSQIILYNLLISQLTEDESTGVAFQSQRHPTSEESDDSRVHGGIPGNVYFNCKNLISSTL